VIQTVCTFGGYVSHEQATLLGSLASTIVICPDKDPMTVNAPSAVSFLKNLVL